MTSTLVIVLIVAVIVLSICLVYLRSTKKNLKEPPEEKKTVQDDLVKIPIPQGKSIIYKNGDEWLVSNSEKSLCKGTEYLIADLSPLNSSVDYSIQCRKDGRTFKLEISYSVFYNLNDVNINIMSANRDSIIIVIDNIILSLISELHYDTGIELCDKFNDIVKNTRTNLYDQLLSNSLRLVSFSIDINKYNSNIIRESYDNSEKPCPMSELDIAEKEKNKEVRLAEINRQKSLELNKINLERIKEDNEYEISRKELDNEKVSKLRSMDISREIKLRRDKEESEHESDLKLESERLKVEKIKHDNNLKIAEMKSEEAIKVAKLTEESRSAEIESEESIKLKEIESKNSISKKEAESMIESMRNEGLVQKEKYTQERDFQYEKIASKERELDLSVKIPAEYEAEKNKILAKSKSEIKKIDTESSIETAKSKLDMKKVEAEVLAKIKKDQDNNDMEVYEKMMSISEKNPSLAVQWKIIDKYEKIAQIQSEAITKMNLGQITINGGTGEEIGKYINSLMPIMNQIKLPEISKISKFENE